MDTELAKYGSTGVALAVIGVLYYIVKIVLTDFKAALKEQATAVKDQADAVRSQAEATRMMSIKLDQAMNTDSEMYTLLKSLNGKLAKAVIDTAKEKQE